MKIYLKILKICLVMLVLLLFSCESKEADDLKLGQEALDRAEVADAEMYFSHFLRKNPNSSERLYVWGKLLDISLHIRQDMEVARSYLEIMLIEFKDDPLISISTMQKLADICQDTGEVMRAISIWEELLKNPTLSQDQKGVIYQKLSKAYLKRLEFSLATEYLDSCLSLDNLDPNISFACTIQLAETQMLTDNLDKAENTLRDVILSKKVPKDQEPFVIFLLADILEQLQKIKEAEQLFLSIQESYPNEKVVQMRLWNLKNRR